MNLSKFASQFTPPNSTEEFSNGIRLQRRNCNEFSTHSLKLGTNSSRHSLGHVYLYRLRYHVMKYFRIWKMCTVCSRLASMAITFAAQPTKCMEDKPDVQWDLSYVISCGVLLSIAILRVYFRRLIIFANERPILCYQCNFILSD